MSTFFFFQYVCRASESRNAGFVFYILNRLQIGLVFVLSFIISFDCHIIVKAQFIGFPHFTNYTVLEINISTSLFKYKREICVIKGPIALYYICTPMTWIEFSFLWHVCHVNVLDPVKFWPGWISIYLDKFWYAAYLL